MCYADHFRLLILALICSSQRINARRIVYRTTPQRLTGGNEFQVRFANEKGRYFEGDILLASPTRAGARTSRWNNGIIPYSLQRSIRSSERQAIIRAMQDIESKTCIRFKPRSRNDTDYVWVTNYNLGCFSYVGKAKRDGQQLNLGPNCFHKTTVIHEFVHAIGFWHEQSRQDRDEWISIQWNNIARNFWSEFQKRTNLENFGTDYDYRSVMHYSYNAFSKNGRPTIYTKRGIPLRLLGAGDSNGGLTETDALQINKMYKCNIQ